MKTYDRFVLTGYSKAGARKLSISSTAKEARAELAKLTGYERAGISRLRVVEKPKELYVRRGEQWIKIKAEKAPKVKEPKKLLRFIGKKRLKEFELFPERAKRERERRRKRRRRRR